MAFIPTEKYAVLPDYFYYLFSAKDWTKGTNRAVMGTTLNKATLGAVSITVPPIDEQRKIAAILDKVSYLIANAASSWTSWMRWSRQGLWRYLGNRMKIQSIGKKMN